MLTEDTAVSSARLASMKAAKNAYAYHTTQISLCNIMNHIGISVGQSVDAASQPFDRHFYYIVFFGGVVLAFQ